MTRAQISRHAYRITIASLTAGICILSAFLLAVAVPDLGVRTADVSTPEPTATASPAPTEGSAMGRSPVGIEMPSDAPCDACHLTTSGTVGTKPIPKLAHPLWGFRDCTACHKPDGLVQTAPGHSSLHKTDCLVCHRAPDKATPSASIAPMRPEHMGTDQPCTACHAEGQHAPLPESMKGRSNCWICHNGPEFKYLFESASPGTTAGDAEGAGAAGGAGSPGTGGASYPLSSGAPAGTNP